MKRYLFCINSSLVIFADRIPQVYASTCRLLVCFMLIVFCYIINGWTQNMSHLSLKPEALGIKHYLKLLDASNPLGLFNSSLRPIEDLFAAGFSVLLKPSFVWNAVEEIDESRDS